MYDAILVSTHYNYTNNGEIIPPGNTQDYADASMDIPLGIVYIAQYLHNRGFKVQVVHLPHEMYSLRYLGLTDDQRAPSVEKILKNYPAHVCGVQAHWYSYCGGAIYIANLYKKLFPDSKLFLGGYMATACWKQFLAVSNAIDGVILGEGEKTLETILEKCLASKGCNLNDVKGLALRNHNGKVIFNPACEESVLELSKMPIIQPQSPPFRNLLWQKRYYINISRGFCPEKCSYCVGNNRHITPRDYGTLKIDHILEQIHIYEESGFHDIFLGENHFLNMSFMTALIENIVQADSAMHFELETHPMIFGNAKLLEKMIQANFFRYTMGCESGSPSLLKRIGRNSNPGQIIGSVKRIVEMGGIVLTSWISNLPGETSSEFRETQEIMCHVVEKGGFIYWVENLHVLPGSKFSDHPQNWGIEILLKTLEDWVRWSILSKKFVTFEEAHEKPLNYLTHLNRNQSPEQMIERFYSNRRLALFLTPDMKSSLEKRLKKLPPDIVKSEMQAIEWFERKGWKLWLF